MYTIQETARRDEWKAGTAIIMMTCFHHYNVHVQRNRGHSLWEEGEGWEGAAVTPSCVSVVRCVAVACADACGSVLVLVEMPSAPSGRCLR